MDLEFFNISVNYGNTTVLHDVYGRADKGEMLAILGPSGTGKSSLLNAITGRIPMSTGTVLLNNQPITNVQRRRIAYVLQTEVFFPNLTLFETLSFHAMLRLPDTMSASQKLQRTEEVMEEFDLGTCRDVIIGNTQIGGLSGGEKKRLNIACEFLTDADVIVIDEPTTGLDSAIAYKIMHILKTYTESRGKTMLITIHQPSSQMFYMLNDILLISSGKVGYFGHAKNVTTFLDNIGLECPLNFNPAEHLLQCISESTLTEQLILDTASELCWAKFKNSRKSITNDIANSMDDTEKKYHFENKCYSDDDIEVGGVFVQHHSDDSNQTNKHEPSKLSTAYNIESNDTSSVQYNNDANNVTDIPKAESYKWATGFWTQYKTLVRRQFKLRTTLFFSLQEIISKLALAIVMGLFWFQLKKTEENIFYREGLIFIMEGHWAFLVASGVTILYHSEDSVVQRERSSGLYRLSCFMLSTFTCEFHLIFFWPLVHITIVYWMVGLTANAWIFLCSCAVIVISLSAMAGITLTIAILVNNTTSAVILATGLCTYFVLGAGVIIINTSIWFSWTKYTSHMYYAVEALLKLEFMYGTGFGNLTLASLTSDFSNSSKNSCDNTLTPADYLNQHLYLSQPLWLDIVVLISIIVFFRLLSYIILSIKQNKMLK